MEAEATDKTILQAALCLSDTMKNDGKRKKRRSRSRHRALRNSPNVHSYQPASCDSERTKKSRPQPRSEEHRFAEVVDIFSMKIPRRPRSKRSTTVVKLRNFSFRDLPSLLDDKSQSTIKQLPLTPFDAQEEVMDDKKIPRKAPRKPKSDVVPRRLVVEPNACRHERQRRRWQNSQGSRGVKTRARETAEGEDVSLAENRNEVVTPVRTRGKRNTARGSNLRLSSKEDGTRKRSLRSVIDRCLLQEQSKKATSEEVTSQRSGAAEETKSLSSKSLSDVGPSQNTSAQEPEIEGCPTVSCLLKKGSVQAGDYVELLPVDSDLVVHGWVTHRGILCAHCAMVHPCKLFGACADLTGDIESLRTKSGCTLAQLCSDAS